MSRPVTLFTGQWADLPLKELAPLAKEMDFDGLELACWGDHFNIVEASGPNGEEYCDDLRGLLEEYGLGVWSISSHLVGQCVCDRIDERHQGILPAYIWGDGDPEGVRQRAAEEMKLTAIAAKNLGVKVVNGFTGSSIWHLAYDFPPALPGMIEAGFADFAKRWTPILDVFAANDVKFALEVHPTEIAHDIVSARRALEAINYHSAFGFNYDPSHLGYQGVDYIKFLYTFKDRIFHVHMKDAWWGHGNGEAGVFGGHTDFGDPARYWDFRSIGHGNVLLEDIIVALNDIGYAGPLSNEWEDKRMERKYGATEACKRIREKDYAPSNIRFDGAFAKQQ